MKHCILIKFFDSQINLNAILSTCFDFELSLTDI